jgi:hypothetical protein
MIPSLEKEAIMETVCTDALGSLQAIQCQAELSQLLAIQSR